MDLVGTIVGRGSGVVVVADITLLDAVAVELARRFDQCASSPKGVVAVVALPPLWLLTAAAESFRPALFLLLSSRLLDLLSVTARLAFPSFSLLNF